MVFLGPLWHFHRCQKIYNLEGESGAADRSGQVGPKGGHLSRLALWRLPPRSPIKAHLGLDRSFINGPSESSAISCVLLGTAVSEQSSLTAWNYQLTAYVLLEIRRETVLSLPGNGHSKDSGEVTGRAEGRMQRNRKAGPLLHFCNVGFFRLL